MLKKDHGAEIMLNYSLSFHTCAMHKQLREALNSLVSYWHLFAIIPYIYCMRYTYPKSDKLKLNNLNKLLRIHNTCRRAAKISTTPRIRIHMDNDLYAKCLIYVRQRWSFILKSFTLEEYIHILFPTEFAAQFKAVKTL